MEAGKLRFIKFEFNGNGLPGHSKTVISEWDATTQDIQLTIQALQEELARRHMEKDA